MIPSIPIAPDNVYKFAALFGLVVFISSMLAPVYVNTKYDELACDTFLQLEILKAKGNLSSDENIRKTVLEQKMYINKSDKTVFMNILSTCAALNMLLAGFGGVFWFAKVQPKQDELLNLQIQKNET